MQFTLFLLCPPFHAFIFITYIDIKIWFVSLYICFMTLCLVLRTRTTLPSFYSFMHFSHIKYNRNICWLNHSQLFCSLPFQNLFWRVKDQWSKLHSHYFNSFVIYLFNKYLFKRVSVTCITSHMKVLMMIQQYSWKLLRSFVAPLKGKIFSIITEVSKKKKN